jgi:hypothetical protein
LIEADVLALSNKLGNYPPKVTRVYNFKAILKHISMHSAHEELLKRYRFPLFNSYSMLAIKY